jgi:hypothetical protein
MKTQSGELHKLRDAIEELRVSKAALMEQVQDERGGDSLPRCVSSGGC